MKLEASKKILLLVFGAGFGTGIALSPAVMAEGNQLGAKKLPGDYMQVATNEDSRGINQYNLGADVESCSRYVTADKRKRFMDEVRKRGLDSASNAARQPSEKLISILTYTATMSSSAAFTPEERATYVMSSLKSIDMWPKNRQEIRDGIQEIEEQLRMEYATEALEHSNCLKQQEMNRTSKPC